MFRKHEGKLSERVFLESAVISVVSILLCIVVLCSMTYAWFTMSVSSGENSFAAGCFGLDVQIADSASLPVDPQAGADGMQVFSLSPGVYTVTLTPSADTTVSKGYAVITAGGVSYATDPVSVSDTEPFTFVLDARTDVTVSFAALWGVSAEARVSRGGTVVIQ